MVEDKNSRNAKPFISIIMPVYNEEPFIHRSLGALLEQSYPKELMEIIIADGMSSDNTRAIITQISNASNTPILLIDNPERVATKGINLAIAKAIGEIIIQVDGHCQIDRNYVANCVKHLQEDEAECVGGPIETVGETFRAKAIATAMSSTFGVGRSAFRTVNNREMYVDIVPFPSYKREILERVGAFNEEFLCNHDDEYNYRLRKLGGRILLSPNIRSRYYSRNTFKELWQQYFLYGCWKVRVLQLHPKQMSLRQFVPLGFVSTIIGLALASLFSITAQNALLTILVLYILANLAATFNATRKTEIKLFPFVFLSFFILHFSYGLGFIYGLFAFWGNWRKNTNGY